MLEINPNSVYFDFRIVPLTVPNIVNEIDFKFSYFLHRASF